MYSTPGGARGVGLLTGKVLAVYLPDHPGHPGYARVPGRVGAVANGEVPETALAPYSAATLRSVLCDVLIYSSGHRGILRLVPVAQERHGRSDGDPWIPRGSANDASGSPAVATKALKNEESAGAISPPGQLDGDTVLVGFVDGDLAQPVILASLSHPFSELSLPAYRAPSAVQGPANVRTIRHRGTVIELDSDGNLLLSAESASSGVYDTTGAEQAGSQGNVTVRAKKGLTIRIEGVDPPTPGPAACSIELSATGGAASANVARVGDSIHIAIDAANNTLWHTFLSSLASAVDTLVGGAPVLAPMYSAASAAGLQGTITTGNPNVRTD